MSKEAMKLALEALEDTLSDDPYPYSLESKAITALREALANEALDRMAENARELGLDYEPAQQEPVAVHQFRKRGCSDWYDGYPDHTDGRGPYQARTLYTSPPAQKEPVDFASLLREAIEAEREACAKVCEDLPAPERMSLDSESFYEHVTLDCAEAIRARSNT